jgi:tetratricopeptide (TPR) repeat protein
LICTEKVVLLLLLWLTCLDGLAEIPTYTNAINAYNKGDFGTAITLLNTAINADQSKNPFAHYYLAGAYLQLGNKKVALDEYRLSLKLAPHGQSAIFCQQAIAKLEACTPQPTAMIQNQKHFMVMPSSVVTKEKMYATIKLANLPALPTAFKDDAPTVSDVLLWTLNQQSAYYLTAVERKNQALARLDQAKDLLKKTESLAASVVPNARLYGETENEMKNRMENGRFQLASILSPYKTAVELAQKQVEQANSIYETCISAGRRLSGY